MNEALNKEVIREIECKLCKMCKHRDRSGSANENGVVNGATFPCKAKIANAVYEPATGKCECSCFARLYTAEDIRKVVDGLENNRKYGMERVVIASLDVIEMLRQSAEALEREKQYEYAAKYFVNGVCTGIGKNHSTDVYTAKNLATPVSKNNENVVIIRRPVGEWEEVKD